VATLATGLIQIAVPLELRELRATPTESGIALSMFGLGFFLFEWIWGALADRYGYRVPLVSSQLLAAVALVFLARAGTVTSIAIGYLAVSGMIVAAGPLGRSFLGTTLAPNLRATGLAMIAAMWVFTSAIGSGVGGLVIDRAGIHAVLGAAAILPLVSAVLLALVFRGYRETRGIWSEDETPVQGRSGTKDFLRVLVITASIVLLAEIGLGGQSALLPLLVTDHLGLSAASAGTALFLVGIFTGVLLVPGGIASDRLGRKPMMVAGAVISAAGFAGFALAGSFIGIVLGAALLAVGTALVWPAATAWISEAAPHRRHALTMSLFGEFENLGVTLGPLAGGLAWSAFGIQAAFVGYAVASLLVAVVAVVAAGGSPPRERGDGEPGAEISGGARRRDRI
jgi:MFS family permease